jgi:general secretion pathway protein C
MSLSPRARRLLRRVPRTTVYSAVELLLLSLLAVQCARLFWALVTPLGPVGEWKAAASLRPAVQASPALLGSFDPFFRLADTSNAPAVVTSLNIKLYGVREDRASGRGSAIIATAEGQQRSFAVGDEIMPGVTLTAVGFDSVTISRAGTPEQIFLDQSSAPSAGTPTRTNFAPAPPPAMSVMPQSPPVYQTAPPPVVQTAPDNAARPQE